MIAAVGKELFFRKVKELEPTCHPEKRSDEGSQNGKE